MIPCRNLSVIASYGDCVFYVRCIFIKTSINLPSFSLNFRLFHYSYWLAACISESLLLIINHEFCLNFTKNGGNFWFCRYEPSSRKFVVLPQRRNCFEEWASWLLSVVIFSLPLIEIAYCYIVFDLTDKLLLAVSPTNFLFTSTRRYYSTFCNCCNAFVLSASSDLFWSLFLLNSTLSPLNSPCTPLICSNSYFAAIYSEIWDCPTMKQR